VAEREEAGDHDRDQRDLAEDSAAPVREAIALALRRRSTHRPRRAAARRDIEIRVAGDPAELTAARRQRSRRDHEQRSDQGVLNAIAKRRNVSQGVSEILVTVPLPRRMRLPPWATCWRTGPRGSAPRDEQDHRPCAGSRRVAPAAGGPSDLSSDHMRRVASIPSDAIAETMSARNDLDDAAMIALSHMVAKRMAELTKKRAADPSPTKPAADLFLNSVIKGGKIGPVCAAISLRAGIAPRSPCAC